MEWLLEVWKWMRRQCGYRRAPIIPTRLFVALFVEPLVLQQSTSIGGGDDEEKEVIPLYFFLQLQDRGKPAVFLSHGWDSWLRHLLFFSDSSLPGQLAAKFTATGKVYLWLDIFAIVQHPGSTKQRDQVAKIGHVVKSIGRTCLVVPGHGSPRFALLPARRSWCCFEIAHTQALSARVGLNKAFFCDRHLSIRPKH